MINARTCNATDFSGCRQAPARIKDAGGPIALAVDQATNTVYVANIGDNFSGQSRTVSVIDGATCNGRAALRLRPRAAAGQSRAGPDGVAVDQATDTVYVVNNGPTNNGDTVSVINGATCNGRRHSAAGRPQHRPGSGTARSGLPWTRPPTPLTPPTTPTQPSR